MKTTSFSISYWFAYLIARIPHSFAQDITLGSSKIANWYDTNNVYKFTVGETIVLKSRQFFGFGVRPEFTVVGYTPHGSYIVDATIDENGNFFQWMENGLPPENCKRVTERKTYSKWDIEYKFKIGKVQ